MSLYNNLRIFINLFYVVPNHKFTATLVLGIILGILYVMSTTVIILTDDGINNLLWKNISYCVIAIMKILVTSVTVFKQEQIEKVRNAKTDYILNEF